MKGGLQTSILAGAALLVCYSLILCEKQKQEPQPSESVSEQEETQRTVQMEQQIKRVHQRIETTRAVARQLIARRLGLREAAAQLQQLDQMLPPNHQDFYTLAFTELFAGPSDNDRYCQKAIAAVDTELVVEPAECRAVTGRLRAELQGQPSHSEKK
jgi:hypothetical protein